ncbi:MAG: PilN domain-containing protein [Selenomonas massiliensis]
MFGGAGFSVPWAVREAVGLSPSAQGLVLVRMCADEEAGGAWKTVELHTAEESCPDCADASAFASFVRRQLMRAGWEKLPLALALPVTEAEICERELPVLLAGEELRGALLWSLRAEADEAGEVLSDTMRLCCTALPHMVPQRYWTARMEEERIRAYFSAFAAQELHLRRLTVCPPHGGILAAEIEAAHDPFVPWETEEPDADGFLSAVYAGLLVRPSAPVHLYWSADQPLLVRMRSHAAMCIGVLATALFLAGVSADLTACWIACEARDHAAEELAQRESERVRMEAFSLLGSDASQREQALAAFMTESHPLRALLVHLGAMTAEGVRISGLRAEEHDLRIEGEAINYEVLAGLIGALEADSFFPSEVTLEHAEQVSVNGRKQIRFTLHSTW